MNRSRHHGSVALCREFATMFELLTAKEKREMEKQQNTSGLISRPARSELGEHRSKAPD